MIRQDGYHDRKLKCNVYTWRDVERTLVGFVYEFSADDVKLVYFSTSEGSTTIRMHRTKAVRIEDPSQYGGWRLETDVDPDNDEVINDLQFPLT